MTKATKATATPSKPVEKPVTLTVKLLVGEKAIKDALMSISRRGQTLQMDIHAACCSVLAHVEKNSDVRLITELLTAVPEMTRKNAIREWFAKHGPVMFEQNTAQFVKGKPCDVKAGMAEPFWSLLPEPVYKPIEVAAFLDQAIKKLARDEKETGKVGQHTALIHALAKLKPANQIAA